MKLNKQKEKELMEVYDTWWYSYLNGDVTTYDHFLDDSYRFVGSTNNEEFLNRQDTTKFFKATADQMSGKARLKNTIRNLEVRDSLVFITDLADAYVLNEDEWIYYGRFRFTSILQEKMEGWRFIYQHFSTTDSKAEEGETLGTEKISKENQELKDAIKRRTAELEQKNRELEIDSALERVRTQSMMMQHSADLDITSRIFHEQLLQLGIKAEFSYLWLPDTHNEKHEFWASWMEMQGMKSDQLSKSVIYDLDREEPYTAACFKAWESDQPVHVQFVPPSEVSHFFETWQDLLSGASQLRAENFTEGIYYAEAYMKYGCFGINIRQPLSPTEENILLRFSIEFERTYTRFLDLEKAEEQAREAQIEAALEKIRSRSLSMQKFDELQYVVSLVAEKLHDLGVVMDASGVVICTYFQDSKNVLHWISSPDFSSSEPFLLTYFDHSILTQAWQSKDRGDEFFSKAFSVDEKNSFFKYAFEHTDYKHFPAEHKEWIFAQEHHTLSFAWSKNSAILIPSQTGFLPSEDDKEIMIRFARVFEQAYIRFLDLKKAEAQAREMKVELSLERIRAQALAMQESSDLLDIVVNMRKEFVGLGHEAHYFWHMRWLPDSYEKAMTSGDGTRIGMIMKLPRHIHGDIELIANWEQSKQPTVVYAMDAQEAVAYVDKMVNMGDFQQIDPNAPSHEDLLAIGGLTFIMARTTHGEIGFSLPGKVEDIPSEDKDTLARFAGAFDLAYRRFEDLKTKEKQNRESQIELALERVRARTMAMERSEELPDAANNLFLQVQALGIPAWSAGYCIWEVEDKESATACMSSEGVFQKPFSLPTIGGGYDFYTPLEKGESFHVAELGGQELVDHYTFMRTLPIMGEILDSIIEAGHPLPTFQIFHIVYFTHGYLMFITYEKVEEAHHIFKRFGQVFEQTYTRFLDLQVKENQSKKILEEKTKLEMTLSKLQATQKQLIHAEKMASLGELTAGIAHEIQNPLNFVNNFSELNAELIDELKEEIEKGDLEEVKAIAKDLKENEQKITHHGKRAEGIVRSMLQHSRSSTGEKELTDINALCDEYLRLAYHGMRAKDKSFNADFELNLDPDLPKIEIIPQDIGRVLLNLINNAFFACSARAKEEDNSYKPVVKVSTNYKPTTSVVGTNEEKFQITISDNGPGIPDDVVEKIFQPFFTTKPTGEGTGLGLSLAYDIVTKGHGGEMKVETESGKGTTFIINLPAK